MTDRKDKTASANAALDEAALDEVSGGITILSGSSGKFTSPYGIGEQSAQSTENTADADAQSDTASQASAPGIMPLSVP